VIATCIGPYWVLSVAPVIVRAAVDGALPPPALPGLVVLPELAAGLLVLAGPLVAAALDAVEARGVAAIRGEAEAGVVCVVTGATEVPAARLDAAGWNLNASSAAMPASVPPRVKTARRNVALP
jgi:hypothetical protein